MKPKPSNISPLRLLSKLFLLCAILLGSLGDLAVILPTPQANAAETAQETANLIAYTAEGFTPSLLTVELGTTVTWRNTAETPLQLRSGMPNRLFLPLIGGPRATAQAAAPTAAQPATEPAFDTLVAPGAEFSFQFTGMGSFAYFDADQPALFGLVDVVGAELPPITQCEDVPASSGAATEAGLPGVLYATAEDRTLLRWFWDDCTTASFAVYRSVDGGPETLVATVTPVTDPDAATNLLNTTDARWPDLAALATGRMLSATDFRAEQAGARSVTDLYHYLYTNGLAGVYLTNQYYPLALMLGWGYLDTDITPGVDYSYRVEALEGSPDGTPRDLGAVDLSAGQRTPLSAPTGVVSGTLDLELSHDDWGAYQRNRRYDGQIYLNWDLDQGVAPDAQLAPELVIGYDVFRATETANDGTILAAENVAADADSMIIPGPQPEPGAGADYLFRYAPGDYDEHTLCVAPRDLLNQAIRWPQDAAQCSAPITVAAGDFLPPAAPENLRANAMANTTTVSLRWSHADAADVQRFLIQRTQDMHCAVGDCWTQVATVAGNSTSWADAASPCVNDPLNPQGCWYRVIATDLAGNRSVPSQAVYAINYDTLPPEQLDLEQYDCDADNPTDTCLDIATSAVSVRINCVFTPEGDEIFIAEIDSTQFEGLNLTAIISAFYETPVSLEGVTCRLILVDDYGNLSDIDDSPPITFDLDSNNPDQLTQPIITRIETSFAAPSDWTATIHWDMAAHPLLGEFEIERTRESTGAVDVLPADGSVRFLTDAAVEQGERYTYVVRATATTPSINDTVSEPRSHRVLLGEDRPLAELTWQGDPTWNVSGDTASSILYLDGSAVAENGVIHYAVFRSLEQDSGYLQITPILQVTGDGIVYTDTTAQRSCYSYMVVSFRTRDGEPNGYSEPRQPNTCAEVVPEIYTPGPVAAAPAVPAPFCLPAAQGLVPDYNFRFGGGFEVVLENIQDDYTGPERVDGGGWLLLETVQETINAPVSFTNLTVDATGRVCSGTATVDLSSLPGGGLDLQTPGGWRYRLTSITLQPWTANSNSALATLDLFTGDAFTNYDQIGTSAERIQLEDATLLTSLRFSYTADLTPGPGHSCANPAVAFRLETLPLDVIPTGVVTINETSITVGSSCTQYVDRFTGPALLLIDSPYTGAPERFLNDGYLAAPLTGGAINLTPAGLDGVFSTDAPLEWFAAYPFAFHVEVDGGLNVALTDSRISGGALGNGTVRVIHHQTADADQEAIVEATFSGFFLGEGGAFAGPLSMGNVRWDAFRMPDITATGWTFFHGALTTPGLPAFRDDDGRGRAIMWEASPSNVTPVALPDGALPGMQEPGFNYRAPETNLEWNNCSDTATFTNVAVDAYLRRSGVTQDYIPLYSPDSIIQVEGYNFIPERFGLRFLDNALVESDISGMLDLPFPSDIQVPLVDIQLTGDINDPEAGENACIAGGSIPEGEQDHTLSYWAVNTRFTSAEFRQQLDEETKLWFKGDIRNLPHLTVAQGAGENAAILPADLAFEPDGNLHDDDTSGPYLDRPDYRFQGFPYLMERFRLSDWAGAGQGEVPAWFEDASANDRPADAIWNVSGFVGLRGVPVAPYFGPISIAAAPNGDNMAMAAWNERITGFAGQPSVSKEWVKVARIRITFDYDSLVHAYDADSGNGRFVGFKDYRFVPDDYLTIPGIPAPVTEALELEQLQVLQLDTGVVIEPRTTGVYLGLSSGVAALRALSETSLIEPSSELLDEWAIRLDINPTARDVYLEQLDLAMAEDDEFGYADTTNVLDDLSLDDLLDEENVGGRTQGLLADKGINIRRLRGVVEVEGEGLNTQFKRFQLSTQVEIKGRDQTPVEKVAPLPENPAEEEEPPLFYAERMTLIIERHGDFILSGTGVESSKFSDKLEAFDATLVINSVKPQFEGGLTLYGLKAGSVTIDNASAVMGIGADVNYMGLSFDGRFTTQPSATEDVDVEVPVGDELTVGGILLAGVVDPNSLVLESNFGDAISQMSTDLGGEDYDPTTMAGFYMRAYVGQIPIIGNGCMLSLQADAELAFWYWQIENGQNFGGLLNPAVYGQVLCAVDARGDLRLRYQQVDGEDRFTGEGYLAGGVGSCEPSDWGLWADRWWDDNACMQAGASLDVTYSTTDGWAVGYSADYERLFGGN